MTTEWRPLPWDCRYSISRDGGVKKHLKSGMEQHLHPFARRDGYMCVKFANKQYAVHRLVYAAFVGPLQGGLMICHLDGSRTNNDPSNLLQATARINASHMVEHGTKLIGEKCGRTNYTDAQIQGLKDALALAPRHPSGRLHNGIPQLLADRFNVSLTAFRHISGGRVWNHVPTAQRRVDGGFDLLVKVSK